MASPRSERDNLQKRLNRIRGQLEGLQRMMNEERHCLEIIAQVRAARSALKAFESELVEGHMNECVEELLDSKLSGQARRKIRELIQTFGRVEA